MTMFMVIYLLYYITINSHTKLIIILGARPRVSHIMFIWNKWLVLAGKRLYLPLTIINKLVIIYDEEQGSPNNLKIFEDVRTVYEHSETDFDRKENLREWDIATQG